MRLTRFLLVSGVLGAGVGLAQAQNLPKFDMKPGKYSYVMESHNPAVPFKMPPMSFTQCVTAKDIDEGRALRTQKDAGVDCQYTNAKSGGGRFSYTATCKIPGDMTMVADYDGKVTGGTITLDVKQKMQGGSMPDNMRSSTMTMVMTRQGDC
ncbi:DUF3617 domain-containing protein [Inhella gelatinilytica]|uniref:DUF3617 family protein n=1 Tax=Inhella gelatinilytica TaxID=2795030 RepID=A0A931J047_9BURK|nr:DUF3617 family protein [Inhella gelatinilytica]MBH9554324.1 DUF3617 family protein [Inhella gelatinilytica]